MKLFLKRGEISSFDNFSKVAFFEMIVKKNKLLDLIHAFEGFEYISKQVIEALIRS